MADSKIAIREVTQAENAALLALTAATPMDGVVGLRIDRDPDFFTLVQMRGEGTVLGAYTEDELIGCISAASRSAYVDGVPHRVYYVGDLKVHPSYRGHHLGARLIEAMHHHILAQGADLVFCVVSEGNVRTFNMLSGRYGVPSFESVGHFSVYQILASPRQAQTSYEIETAEAADIPALCRLVNQFNAAYQFAPVHVETEWQGYLQEAGRGRPLQILVAREGGAIRAMLSVLDTTYAKQHVVTAMPARLQAAVTLSHILGRVAPLVPFPKAGEPVRMRYIRHPAVVKGHEKAFRALVQVVRQQAYAQRYPFIVIGLHERDPLCNALRWMPRFTVGSHGLVASLQHNQALLDRILAGIPMEDYALA